MDNYNGENGHFIFSLIGGAIGGPVGAVIAEILKELIDDISNFDLTE